MGKLIYAGFTEEVIANCFCYMYDTFWLKFMVLGSYVQQKIDRFKMFCSKPLEIKNNIKSIVLLCFHSNFYKIIKMIVNIF